MVALKCDKCGRFYNNYADIDRENNSTKNTNIINTIRPCTEFSYNLAYRGREQDPIDLCPACAKSFCEWMGWTDRISDYIPYLLESEPKKDEEAETE